MRGTLNFDGGGQAPGPITAGTLIHYDGKDHECGRAWADGTHNQAEYRALILGLRRAHSLGITELDIRGDSKLVVEQIAERWKVKNPDLQELRQVARAQLDKLDDWDIRHVPREQNSRADAVGRAALKAMLADLQ